MDERLIQLDRDGRNMPLFIAAPDGDGPFPAVIVVHEIFGLNDHIKDIARRFAREGFVAYAPDIFEGHQGVPADKNDLNAMRALWSNIPDAVLISDLSAVFAMAQLEDRVRGDQIGTIGYCMGGAIAYMFGATCGVAWIADYYGRIKYPQLSETKPKHPIDYTDTLSCPVLGLFSGVDELIPVDQVDELKQRIEAKGIPCEFKVYDDAKHAFFNDTREFYNADAAKDAWKRTLEFIARSTKVRR
jgi:carboxymethylenebutenolidase